MNFLRIQSPNIAFSWWIHSSTDNRKRLQIENAAHIISQKSSIFFSELVFLLLFLAIKNLCFDNLYEISKIIINKNMILEFIFLVPLIMITMSKRF